MQFNAWLLNEIRSSLQTSCCRNSVQLLREIISNMHETVFTHFRLLLFCMCSDFLSRDWVWNTFHIFSLLWLAKQNTYSSDQKKISCKQRMLLHQIQQNWFYAMHWIFRVIIARKYNKLKKHIYKYTYALTHTSILYISNTIVWNYFVYNYFKHCSVKYFDIFQSICIQ